MGSQSESSSGDYWRLADASLDFLSFKQKKSFVTREDFSSLVAMA
jgi:hypothetical protein